MMRHRQGFTLIELLVVIAIIGLLVSILAPSLISILGMGKIAVCSSNLKSIGNGAHSYASNNDQSLPFHADGSAYIHCAGKGHTSDNTASYSNSRPWYLLVSEGIVPIASFTCPADSGAEPLLVAEAGAYDFDCSDKDRRPLSYSLQAVLSGQSANTPYDAGNTRHCQPVTMLNSSALVIGADYTGLGYWKWSTYWRSPRNTVTMDESNPGLMNSENHERRGQNVLSLDGHVKFEESPMVGIDGDNIWTRRGRTSVSAAEFVTDRPADKDDTLLKP